MLRLPFLIVLHMLAMTVVNACFSYPHLDRVVPRPPDHSLWDQLLREHVDDKGWVDYKGFIKDSVRLNRYLAILSQTPPDKDKWTRQAQLAYWINAYNAFTVQIVIRHYPVKSIKDIAEGLKIPFVSTTWDIPFITIGGSKMDLNTIEHGILRKQFQEPRIHFAINCASVSCPVLRREAYTADKLDRQLEEQTRAFINDPLRNQTGGKTGAALSRIFQWFSDDFKSDGNDVRTYVNRYANSPIPTRAKISYLEYDWRLNEKPGK